MVLPNSRWLGDPPRVTEENENAGSHGQCLERRGVANCMRFVQKNRFVGIPYHVMTHLLMVQQHLFVISPAIQL